MIAVIQRNQIRFFKNEDGKDRLQLGVQFVEYPDLPTYGLNVDVTGLTTQAEVKAAIIPELQALQTRIEAYIQDFATARAYFDAWGWSDTQFEIDNL